MARRYYDTAQRVYQLFKNHPALSQMYEEFGVETDGVKRVSEFLVLNHDKIDAYDLQNIYKSRTTNTYEPDQEDPIKGEVENFVDLPMINIDQGDIWYVSSPYPGTYYYWDGVEWKEDPDSKDKARLLYLETLYQEVGHKVWEDEYGTFIAMEDDNAEIYWEAIEIDTVNFNVIRMSQLPTNPNPGDVYEVLGEDLIDIIASLYGMVDMGMTPPWSQYVSAKQTNLLELLNMTVYLYRYGVTDNFYENNIWQFIPEFDRDEMLAQPKIKLFMESIGRKLDQLEDKLIRLEDVYDIDETPTELLDHLGQMLGYEKEDFSLSDVSFRELLKNIIEIYKIKGTNYSFSFFFKFLGFNVNLKEFYFNKNVKNPEAFPGMDVENVEYYLTTTNPIVETTWGNPAPNLDDIRSLDDWELEYGMLIDAGCSNPIEYMLGNEPHSKDGLTMHSNPWGYFKTNLIEYELNPFFDKVSLTSSDNETIQKYIKFLSPTYLFTWININLSPWIEDINIFENVEEVIAFELGKTFGDMTDEGFNDWEEVEDYLQVWDEKDNKLISYKKADDMGLEIVNNLNLGGDDQVGAQLKHDGVYIRQPGHPSHITNVYHDGSTHLSFDNLEIMIKPVDDLDYDDSYTLLSDLPVIALEGTISYVEENGLYYIYEDPSPYWSLIEEDAEIPTSLDDKYIVTAYNQLTNKIETSLTDGDIYYVSDITSYYQYSESQVDWNLVQFSEVVSWYKTEYFVEQGNDLNNLSVDSGTIYYVVEDDSFFSYSTITSSWSLITDIYMTSNSNAQTLDLLGSRSTTTYYTTLVLKLPAEKDMIYQTSSTNRYYRFIDEDAYWKQAYETEDRYSKWYDYSYRPFPSYPINVKPSPGIKLSLNIINFVWDDIFAQQGYWFQLSKYSDFSELIEERLISDSKNYVENITIGNDNYYWRVRTKNNLSVQQISEEELSRIEAITTTVELEDGSTITEQKYPTIRSYYDETLTIRSDITTQELNILSGILAGSGSEFEWQSWSSIYRFEVFGYPFPYNNQIINDTEYQYVQEIKDEITGAIMAYSLEFMWKAGTNVETYEFVLSRDSDFSVVILSEEVDENSVTVEIPADIYYWKYRAKKYNKDWGDYSDSMTFEIDL